MEYKVSELAEKAGVTKRTIHYYISKGLLLPPKGSGINSVYDDEHLERILLIKKYIRENVCDIFEIHYSEKNAEKYKHIIENVKKYVEKMMED